MQKLNLKTIVLLLGLLLPAMYYQVNGSNLTDGVGPIVIQESNVQGVPKGSTIQASIDGHTLTVVFTENIGQVIVEITTAAGATVQCLWVVTPDGLQTYIPSTGDYVITFTLSNGDEYYGEFTVAD